MNLARLKRLESYVLQHGSHKDPKEGMCAMEFVAYLAEESHTDSPQCACPVIAVFVRSWNDSLKDEDRNRLLKPLIPRLVGSRSTPEIEKQRSYLALDWLIREFLPTWLEQVDSLRAHAAEIRALEAIRDLEAAQLAGPKVRAAGDAARAADAAWAAARAAAGDAAWAASRAASRAADAAVAAAGEAARDAAWASDAAGDAAWAAAWAAARAAAGEAARDAAGDAAWAADAEGDAIRPTVERLQTSALDLVERMLACQVAR